MTSILENQYAMLKGSREIVLTFLETKVERDLNTPVVSFDNRTISYLLAHVADCYFHWLGYFALQQPVELLNDSDYKTMSRIRQLYARSDNTMDIFLEKFKKKTDQPIIATHVRNGLLSVSPLQLFTHVLTHEFHHKGQIMSMCRILGYIPPDTDVSRLF